MKKLLSAVALLLSLNSFNADASLERKVESIDSDDTVPEGKEVTLTVDGNGLCSGEVTFDIAEVDCVVGCDYDDIDQVDTDELNVKQVSATFSDDGINNAVATWIAEWVQDDGGLDEDPEYYFKATWAPDFRADSDELKVEAGICGDGIVQVPNSEGLDEQCDGSDLGDETSCESYLGDDWEGALDCYPEDDDNECKYDTSQCDDDDSNPDDPDNTFRQWGECVDDGNGDNIGTREVYLYDSTSGQQLCDATWPPVDPCVYLIEECFLGEEEVPFFGFLSFVMFLFIVGIFYSNEIFKKKDNINKNNKEVE